MMSSRANNNQSVLTSGYGSKFSAKMASNNRLASEAHPSEIMDASVSTRASSVKSAASSSRSSAKSSKASSRASPSSQPQSTLTMTMQNNHSTLSSKMSEQPPQVYAFDQLRNMFDQTPDGSIESEAVSLADGTSRIRSTPVSLAPSEDEDSKTASVFSKQTDAATSNHSKVTAGFGGASSTAKTTMTAAPSSVQSSTKSSVLSSAKSSAPKSSKMMMSSARLGSAPLTKSNLESLESGASSCSPRSTVVSGQNRMASKVASTAPVSAQSSAMMSARSIPKSSKMAESVLTSTGNLSSQQKLQSVRSAASSKKVSMPGHEDQNNMFTIAPASSMRGDAAHVDAEMARNHREVMYSMGAKSDDGMSSQSSEIVSQGGKSDQLALALQSGGLQRELLDKNNFPDSFASDLSLVGLPNKNNNKVIETSNKTTRTDESGAHKKDPYIYRTATTTCVTKVRRVIKKKAGEADDGKDHDVIDYITKAKKKTTKLQKPDGDELVRKRMYKERAIKKNDEYVWQQEGGAQPAALLDC